MKVKHSIVETLPVSHQVGIWNIWDFEHDTHIHDYTFCEVLHEDDTTALLNEGSRIPFFPFIVSKSLIFIKRIDNDTTISIHQGPFGIVSKATMKVIELEIRKSKFVMNYEVDLPGWTRILSPLMKFMIKKWTAKTWKEDIPLKLRRQKVLDAGFQDFVGLPSSINERKMGMRNQLRVPIQKFQPTNCKKFKIPQ